MRLESQVYDLDKLAEIAENLVCECADVAVAAAGPTRSGELAICIVQVMRDRVRAFKSDYLSSDRR